MNARRQTRSRPITPSSAVNTRGGSCGTTRCSANARPKGRAWAAENAPYRANASSNVRSPPSTARSSRPQAIPK